MATVRQDSYFEGVRSSEISGVLSFSFSKILAYVAAMLCFMLLVDAAIAQLEIAAGRAPVGNALLKIVLLAIVLLGLLIKPGVRAAGLPIVTWLLCIVYLVVDIPHLISTRGMTFTDVLLSYNTYYMLLLIGPAFIAFRGTISERFVVRSTLLLFAICAAIGIAQFVSGEPIVATESLDGTVMVHSWNFFGQVRAFSLFTSAMGFGIFCALCGALGVALFRRFPKSGGLLVLVSALVCYATLTRLCYLVFLCACSYALVLRYGKNPKRGLWYPAIYSLLGVATVAVGVSSLLAGDSENIQDSGSLVMRLAQWGYYADLLSHTPVNDLLFGIGIVQNEKILPLYPMIIDNIFLGLVLHVGIVGLGLFGTLMVKMWLFLRREAISTGTAFAIAAASLWATLACAGVFNILFSTFGAVFALSLLCIFPPSVADVKPTRL